MKKIVIDARESGTSTGRYIDKLVENLNKLKTGLEIIILTKPHRVEFFKEFADKFQIIDSSYKEFSFGEQLGFKNQLKKLSPDLVHFGMVQQPILYKGNVVTTMHDLITTEFKNPAKNPIIFAFKQMVYRWVNRVAALKSNAIITPTNYVKDDVAKFARINSRKIVVTYEAADKINDSPEPYEELENTNYIMYVGRPQSHKNLYRLVSAFSELKQTNSDLKLVLVGKKDVLYDKLESWVADQAIEDVIFAGFVSEGQLRWLYENCKAYVFPSLSEGFGLPGLEAMCHGAPVVSSKATCLPEVYGKAAVYFDPNDIGDMVKQINSVLKSSVLREELIKLGHSQVRKYSWKLMAEQTLDVYKSVLKDTISQ